MECADIEAFNLPRGTKIVFTLQFYFARSYSLFSFASILVFLEKRIVLFYWS